MEEQLVKLLEFYQDTGDDAVRKAILTAYYDGNKNEQNRRYRENYEILKTYPYFYGKKEPSEIRYYPLYIGKKFLWYYDSKEGVFENIKHYKISLEEPRDASWAVSNLLWADELFMIERETRKKIPFLDMEHPLLAVYGKKEWEIFLQIQDLSKLTALDRIVFFDGIDHFEEAILDDGITFPKMAAGDLADEMLEAMEALQKKFADRMKEGNEQAKAYYKKNREEILGRIREGRPKILFLTTRFSTAVQYHIRDCRAAADDMGLETELFIEKYRFCCNGTSYYVIEKINQFHPDMIFILDYSRYEFSEIMEGIDPLVWVCWAQDPLEKFFCGETASMQGKMDVVVSEFYCWDKFLNAGYDKERLIFYPLVANHKLYHTYELSGQERLEYGSDICMICHNGPPEEKAESYAANFQGESRKFIYNLYLEYIVYVRETGHIFMRNEEYADYIQKYAMRQYGCRIDDDIAGFIVDNMGMHFKANLYRERLAHWLIDAGYTNLKLWGNGWDRMPKCRPFAMGAAQNGEVMGKIIQASKIVLGVNAFMTGPSRVAETLLNGAFYLGNGIPPEADASDIRHYFKEGQDMIFWKDREDFLEKIEFYLAHDEERKRMAQIGHQKALELLTYEKFMDNIIKKTAKMI